MSTETTPQPDPTAALGAELAATMPEVTIKTQTAPAPTEPAAAQPPPENMGLDSLNRSFDPQKFRPEKDSIGRWKNLKGGRHKKTENAPAQPLPPPPPVSQSFIAPDFDEPLPATAATAQTAAVVVEDAQSAPEDNAEVICQGVYTLTGFATGQMEEATPTPAEHNALRKTLAAYFKARGWVAVGTFAVLIAGAAYLIRVIRKKETSQIVRGWISRFWKPELKNVTSAPASVAPTASAEPVAAPSKAKVLSAFSNQ